MSQGQSLPSRRRRGVNLSAVYATLGAAMCVLLSGCGISAPTTSSTATLSLHGRVHGGQQAVSGSSVQLYTVGTSGNGSSSTPLIPTGQYYLGGSTGCVPSSTQTCYTGVISDAYGNFTLTGDYTCPSATAQVYIVATGGNPGLTPGTTNNALILVNALGSCGNLSSATFAYLNEVTTVAAAWALAPFASSYSHIGATSTNSLGIANAFLDAGLLANSATGNAATLPANLTIETGKLYALANVIAPCVNSDGTSGCATLFSAAKPSGSAAPTDTFGAALNIVKNPGYNVTAVYGATNPQAPFPTLSKSPNDWTMSLTVTDPSMASPTGLGIDSLGNVWVANYDCPLDLFSPQGTLLVNSAASCSYDSETYGLTVDSNSDVWITSEETPNHGTAGAITKFNGATRGQTAGTLFNSSLPYAYDSSVDYPLGLGADNNGDVATANYANSSSTIINTSGAVIGSGYGSGNASFPVAVAFDANHGVWLANQSDSTITHVDVNGNVLSRPSCCDGANGVAVDSAGNAWVSSYYGSSLSEVRSDGHVLIQNETVGGLNHPAGIALDAAQNIWTVNYRGTSFTEIAGIANTLPAGTAISPGPTSFNTGGYGLDASLSLPFAIAPDPSGNLWVSNFAHNDLVMFFGLATPTKTPSVVYPAAP